MYSGRPISFSCTKEMVSHGNFEECIRYKVGGKLLRIDVDSSALGTSTMASCIVHRPDLPPPAVLYCAEVLNSPLGLAISSYRFRVYSGC